MKILVEKKRPGILKKKPIKLSAKTSLQNSAHHSSQLSSKIGTKTHTKVNSRGSSASRPISGVSFKGTNPQMAITNAQVRAPRVAKKTDQQSNTGRRYTEAAGQKLIHGDAQQAFLPQSQLRFKAGNFNRATLP